MTNPTATPAQVAIDTDTTIAIDLETAAGEILGHVARRPSELPVGTVLSNGAGVHFKVVGPARVNERLAELKAQFGEQMAAAGLEASWDGVIVPVEKV